MLVQRHGDPTAKGVYVVTSPNGEAAVRPQTQEPVNITWLASLSTTFVEIRLYKPNPDEPV